MFIYEMEQEMRGWGEELAYDLRTFYAKIVGFHLVYVADARKNKQYHRYWNELRDLEVVVAHKMKEKDKDGVLLLDKYNVLVANAKAMIKKHSLIYYNAKPNASDKDREELEDALYAVEKFLYEQMDDASMFGSKRNVQGL